MQTFPHTVAALLPHRPPMVLLDELLDWDECWVSSVVTVRPGIPFFVKDSGVPSHVGLEYMAQTCGLYAGIQALHSGLKVRLGFLLGTRNFHAAEDWFRPGQKLEVKVVEMFRQDLMGVFDCRILSDGTEVASAQLSLYQPADISKVLGGGTST